jgi:hypothetical protein
MPTIITEMGPGLAGWGGEEPPYYLDADDGTPFPWEKSNDPSLADMPEPPPPTPRPRPQGRQEAQQSDLLEEVTLLVGADSEGILDELRKHVEARHDASMEISRLKAEAKTLEALFGKQGGSMAQTHYEHERSMLLAELKEAARVRYKRDPDTKTNSKGDEVVIELTDGRADDLARGDPLYKSHLKEAERNRERYAELQAQISKAFAEKEKRDGLITYCRERLDTIRALIYYESSRRKHS